MKKLVPDPPHPSKPPPAPLGTLRQTVDTIFGSCDAGHAPPFTVRAGIPAEDALVHASLYLKCACDTANAACNSTGDVQEGLLWSVLHSAEMAKALVDALLDRAEGGGVAPVEKPGL